MTGTDNGDIDMSFNAGDMAGEQQLSKLVEYSDSSSSDELFIAKKPPARNRMEHTGARDDKQAKDSDSSSSDELFVAKKPRIRRRVELTETRDTKQPVVKEKRETPKLVADSDSDEPLLAKLNRRKAKETDLLANAEQVGDQGTSDSDEPLLAKFHRRKAKGAVLLANAEQVGDQDTATEQGVDESVAGYQQEWFGEVPMFHEDVVGDLAWDRLVAEGVLEDVPFEARPWTAYVAQAATTAAVETQVAAAAAAPYEKALAELAAFERGASAAAIANRPPFECVDPEWLTW